MQNEWSGKREAGGRYEGRECNQWMSSLAATILKVTRRAIFGSFKMTAFCFQFRSLSIYNSLCKVTNKRAHTQKMATN